MSNLKIASNSNKFMGSKARGSDIKSFYQNGELYGVKTALAFKRLPPVDYSELVSAGESLSRLFHLNEQTITKKVPSDNPDSLILPTYQKWKSMDDENLKTNIRFGVGSINPLDTATMVLARAKAPSDNIRWFALRNIFQRAVKPYRHKGDKAMYFGPGKSVCKKREFRGRKDGFMELKDKIYTSSSRLNKSQCNYLYSNRAFKPEDWGLRPLENAGHSISADGDYNPLAGGGFVPAKYMQVPKTGTINRSIVVGTSGQIHAQRCIDKQLRGCLRHLGIDLNNLAFINQTKAYLGSVHRGCYQTLDLTSASDSISIGILAFLCKGDQTSETLFKDIWETRNTAVSVSLKGLPEHVCFPQGVDGMGNPAIFSLESLLFTVVNAWGYISYVNDENEGSGTSPWSFEPRGFQFATKRNRKGQVIQCLSWSDFASFGDDQAPLAGVPLPFWRKLLRECGFILNEEKSFSSESVDHQFRESCGADFRNGKLVRGFYLRTRNPTMFDAVRMFNFFSLYYGATEEQKACYPLYKRVKRFMVGAWADLRTFTLSPRLWENRVPTDVLLVSDCLGTVSKVLVTSDGTRKSYHESCDGDFTSPMLDVALNAFLERETQSETIMWYETPEVRYYCLVKLKESQQIARKSDLSMDLAQGRRAPRIQVLPGEVGLVGYYINYSYTSKSCSESESSSYYEAQYKLSFIQCLSQKDAHWAILKYLTQRYKYLELPPHVSLCGN